MSKIIYALKEGIKDSKIAIKKYFKIQLIIFFINFSILAFGLNKMDLNFYILIAIFLSVLDFFPILDMGIIMIPWSIINFIIGSKEVAKSLAILYIFLFLLRQVIEIKTIGDSLGLRPLHTLIVTVVGILVFGPIGSLIGPLISLIIKSIIRVYTRDSNE